MGGGGIWAKYVNDFKARVIADGGTMESPSCAKTDVKFLVENPEPVAFTGLLNDYSGAAAAYSLRLLDNTYSGDAIVVRRASDNTTQSIGFVNNELDTATLESFCSGTDGFVTTWYDQSGNGNDATQATASSQPKIVSSGSTILENGKAAAQFDGSDDGMEMNTTFNLSNVSTSFVFSADTGNDDVLYEISQNSSNFLSFGIGNLGTQDAYGTRFRISGTDYSVGESGVSGQKLAFHIGNQSATSIDLYLNNTEATGTQKSRAGVLGDSTLGYRNAGGNAANAKIQEFVIYELDQSINRTGIETNINTHYSIY